MSKRICVKVDEYEKDGKVKGKYIEIGVILNNNDGEYVLLNPYVDLAGILLSQNILNHKKDKSNNLKVSASIFSNENESQVHNNYLKNTNNYNSGLPAPNYTQPNNQNFPSQNNNLNYTQPNNQNERPTPF